MANNKKNYDSLETILEKLDAQERRLARIEQRLFGMGAPAHAIQKKSVLVVEPLKPAAAKSAARTTWEINIGNYLLQIIGVVIFIAGMIFFLKYAIDQGWINPIARIVVGAGSALALIIGGEFIRKQQWSLGLIAGGVVLLYVSLYAAHNLYALIDLPIALICTGFITAVALGLALYHNSSFIAYFSLVGGMLIPSILSTPSLFDYFKISDFATIMDPNHALFLVYYLLPISCAFVAISYVKKWDWLALLTFVFMIQPCLVIWSIIEENNILLFFYIAYFAIFALLPYGLVLAQPRITGPVWIVLNAASGIISFFGIKEQLYKILTDEVISADACFKLMLFFFGALYTAKTLGLWYRNKKDVHFIVELLTMATGFFCSVIFMQFTTQTRSVALFAYALGLFVLGLILRTWVLRLFAALAAALALGNYILFMRVTPSYDSLIFNELNAATLCLFSLFVIGAYLAHRYKKILTNEEHPVAALLEVGAVSMVALWIYSPLWEFPYNVIASILYPLVIAIIGVATRRNYFLWCAYTLTGISLLLFSRELVKWASIFLLTVIPLDASFLKDTPLLCTALSVLYAVVAMIFSYALYQMHKKTKLPEHELAYQCYLLLSTFMILTTGRIALTIYPLSTNADAALLAIFEAFVSVGTICAGFLLQQKILRYAGIVLTLSTLFVVGSMILGFENTVHRIIASLVVGIIFIAASFIYQRLSKRLQ